MANLPARPSRRDVIGEHLLTAYIITVSLGRALIFTVFALGLFLLAFLGYFTISFVFLGGALLILASTNVRSRYRRLRQRARTR
ncbi:MAG: hypothetical protein DWI48_03490 [Chloroflexi bacterium]|nr:MAG: hypothetical protein DWI48_03490 [Chloroflexota bacterium]